MVGAALRADRARRGVIVRKTERQGRLSEATASIPPDVRFVALLQRCRLAKPEKFQTERRVGRGVPSGTPLHVFCWASQGLAKGVIEAVPFSCSGIVAMLEMKRAGEQESFKCEEREERRILHPAERHSS